jgi:hypothetical protein
MIAMPTTSQPKYSESPHKFMAREFNKRLYRLITGNHSIPSDKQYITLANLQDRTPTSEINQYVSSGLLLPNQFVGIDSEKKYITRNKKNHPNATWIHGKWNIIISSNNFNPSLVYLDSTHFADRPPALETLRNTLGICDHGTLLICNVMETNPRSGLGSLLDTTALVSGLLEDQIPAAYMDWNKDKENASMEEIKNSSMRVESYTYRTTDRTLMKSFIFYKGVLPSQLEIQNEFKKFDSWCSELERNIS